MRMAIRHSLRTNYLHPVQRIKHVRDVQTAVPVNTALPNNFAVANDSPSLSNVNECLTGSVIRSFFVSIECVASETSTTATSNIYVIFFKNPGGNLTIPNGNVVGASDNKKYIFHQEMVMINPVDGGVPRNIFKGVLKVPKHMQRMAPNDILGFQLFIPSTGVAVNACSQVHYKELR